jgi:hypothetical protein
VPLPLTSHPAPLPASNVPGGTSTWPTSTPGALRTKTRNPKLLAVKKIRYGRSVTLATTPSTSSSGA